MDWSWKAMRIIVYTIYPWNSMETAWESMVEYADSHEFRYILVRLYHE